MGRGVAQSPVTFLTHFRIPSLPLLFLLHPGRLRGHPRSEEPSASTPGHRGRGAPAVRLCGALGRCRPPPLSPASLARPLPGHMGSQAPVGDLSPQRSPSRHPRRSPLPEGKGTRPHSRSAHSALLQEGTEAGGRNLPSFFSFIKCKSATAAQQLDRRDRPPSIPPPPRRSGEVGCARPQPASAGNLGCSRAPRGVLPRLGGGRRGEGR